MMKGAGGFLLFLVVSAGVHAGLLLVLPRDGVAGQGDDGADIVTLAASSAAHGDLIAAWESAPQVAPAPDQPQARFDAAPPRPPAAEAPMPRAPRPPDPGPAAFDAPAGVATASAPRPDLSAGPQMGRPELPAPLPEGSAAVLPQTDVRPGRPSAPADVPPGAPGGERPAAPAPDAAPAADVAPHVPGASALAAATSPRPVERPGERPADIAPPPAPSAAAPSAAAPERIASGSGAGTAQGAAPAPTPGEAATGAQVASLMGQWGGQIQAQIARARPTMTGSGRVVVRMSVAPDGRLVGLGLAASSGDPVLDQAALETVRRAGRFPRAPGGLAEPSYSFSVPLTFR